MLTQIDLAALVDFVDTTLDYSEDFEEDEFAFSFLGDRIYCQRRTHCFKLLVHDQVLELPR